MAGGAGVDVVAFSFSLGFGLGLAADWPCFSLETFGAVGPLMLVLPGLSF